MSDKNILNVSKNKQVKKSFLQEVQQKDIQNLIDEKDQYIRKLQYKIEKLERENSELIKAGPGQVNINNFYKQKLEIQISENDKATQLFLNISHRMLKLIDMMKTKNQFSDDSSEVKNLIGLIGSANQSGLKIQNMSLNSSDPEGIENIQNEVEKRFQQLQSVCDTFHKSFMKIQKQIKGFQKRLKDSKSQFEDELRTVNKELKQARQGKEHLKILLQKNQDEKNEILLKIANVMDAKTRKQVDQLSRQGLIQYVKKLMYRMTQVQSAKMEVIKQNKKIKTTDLEKYKKILNQVKEVKEMSRLGKSMV